MRLLILDDEAIRHDAFDESHPSDEVHHAYNFEQFERALYREEFDVISFDHDLGSGANGYDCATFMLQRIPFQKWPKTAWVHSWNPSGALAICDLLLRAGLKVERRPFACREGSVSQ